MALTLWFGGCAAVFGASSKLAPELQSADPGTQVRVIVVRGDKAVSGDKAVWGDKTSVATRYPPPIPILTFQ
jgi:hypothetical protein